MPDTVPREGTPLLPPSTCPDVIDSCEPHNYESLTDGRKATATPISVVKVQDGGEENTFSIKSLSGKSKYILVMMSLANLLNSCCFALLAPFFPEEAERKGLSATTVGLIFSTFEFIIFLSSPIFGNYLTTIGPNFMFMSGTFVGGVGSILFGFVDRCPPDVSFTVICFVCRCVQALGMSAFLTSSLAIVSYEFPNNVASVFGVMETANGVGLMVGPAIGGALYEAGGFGMPFFVLGGLILLSSVFIFRALPHPPANLGGERRSSVFSLMKSSYILVTMLSIAAAAGSLGFLDPTLSNHLGQFDLSVALVGLIFVVSPTMYAITGPLWGYLTDHKNVETSLLVMGNLMGGVGFLLVGPSPLLSFLPVDISIIITGLTVYGVAVGCVIVPSMTCLLIGAMEIGFENNFDTYGLVAGLFNSVYCIGTTIGCSVGSFLVDSVGFRYTATGITGLFFLITIWSIIYFTVRRLRGSPRLELSSPEQVVVVVEPCQSSQPSVKSSPPPDRSQHYQIGNESTEC